MSPCSRYSRRFSAASPIKPEITARAAALSSPALFAAISTKDDPVPYIPAAHHFVIDRALVDAEQRRTKMVIIQTAVQHGKSELASRWFPVWYLGHHPDHYVVVCSYATEFAQDSMGRISRKYMERHGEQFFGLRVDPTSSAKGRWNIDGHKGQMIAQGIDAGIAGRPADVLIIDDPYANLEQAMSPTYRKKVWDAWQYELATRLKPDGIVVVIMSRWTEQDFVGQLRADYDERGEPYTLVDLPAIALENDALGRKPGEALWPAVRPIEWLEKQRATVGPRAFDALYQGRPRPDGGAIFQQAWFRYYDVANGVFRLRDNHGRIVRLIQVAQCRIFMTVDLATGNSATTGDYFCIGVFALGPQRELIVLDVFRERTPGPQQLSIVRSVRAKWNAVRIGIEAVAYQWAFVQQAVADGLPVVPITRGRESKEVRAYLIAARYELGEAWHPAGSIPWVDILEQEMLSFPRGVNDDQVDVLSDAGTVVVDGINTVAPVGVRVG